MEEKLKISQSNVIKYNILMSLLLQIATIASGFIIPKLILSTFGSEVNGLVSSLNQFLNYISLLEGGISGVIMANLYKPLYEKDNEKISSIVKTTRSFFKKIAIIFTIYTLILGVIYPFVVKTSFSYIYIFSLVLILSFNLFNQYFFSLTLKLLLQSDKKIWFISLIQVICIVLNICVTYIIIKLYPSIHIVKLLTAIIFLLQPLIYNFYVKKHYDLNKNAPIDNNLIKDRWNGFGINIASFVHNCTDEVILSIFTNLSNVSIYAIYLMVVNGIKSFVNAISNAINPSLGNKIAKGNKQELNDFFDLNEFLIYFVTYFLFTVGGLLITPFVMIYTNDINDTNYYQPFLGWSMILAEFIFCIRDPYVGIAYSANEFKKITPYAIIEAILNIIVSLILVFFLGINGVAIGTVVSLAYRTFMQIYFLRKNILNRPMIKAFKKLLIFSFGFILIVLISNTLITIDYTILGWIKSGIIISLLSLIVYSIISYIFYNKEFEFLLNRLKLRKDKK